MYICKRFLLLTFTLCALVQVCEAKRLSCSGDYKLTVAGQAQGVPHQDIERAGVILVKDYGRDVPGKPNSRYAVILGHTRGSTNHYNFPAGQCDRSDRSSTVTASRELKEETGCAVKISPHHLSKQPYIYSALKQLFFVRDDRLSVSHITKSCQSACKNKRLPRCYREVDHAVCVPLSELLKLAARIRQQNLHPTQYVVQSRTSNKLVRIDGYYMRMIANRLPEVRLILNHLLPGGHF